LSEAKAMSSLSPGRGFWQREESDLQGGLAAVKLPAVWSTGKVSAWSGIMLAGGFPVELPE